MTYHQNPRLHLHKFYKEHTFQKRFLRSSSIQFPSLTNLSLPCKQSILNTIRIGHGIWPLHLSCELPWYEHEEILNKHSTSNYLHTLDVFQGCNMT